MEIENCIDCPLLQKEYDGHGMDGRTELYCLKTGDYLGYAKTRWLASGMSSIYPSENCPFKERKED